MKNIFEEEININDSVRLINDITNEKEVLFKSAGYNISLESWLSVIDTFPENVIVIDFKGEIAILDKDIKTNSGMLTKYISIDMLTINK